LTKLEVTREIVLKNKEEAIKLLGYNGEFKRRLQSEVPVRIVDRGQRVALIGKDEDVTVIDGLLNEMLTVIRRGHEPTFADFQYALEEAKSKDVNGLGDALTDAVTVSRRGNVVRPRTRGQRQYVEAMRTHDIVFSIGPAGTGKTYLAMAMALSSLMQREVARLVLCRPAVEAGESLGFLPGDLERKVNPYLRPLYDALYDMLGAGDLARYVEKDMIEIAPLAYMRGRTLSNAFAVLDEAQNTTHEQMKMFLTRLGRNSKTVITGDITQIDLPRGKASGLVEAVGILAETDGVAFAYLTRKDVVRHKLVQDIIDAYEVSEKNEQSGRQGETAADNSDSRGRFAADGEEHGAAQAGQ
jgi:phosphate starvation-inducible PhoH-like protein